jgi:thiamine kinase-like enzyme
MAARIGALSFWKGPVALRPLVGGLCNKNFIAQDLSGTYVARVGRDIPVHGIFQPFVQTAMRSAADIGVTPALRHTSSVISVTDFIDGRHLRPEDMRDERILAALVGCVRRLHEGAEAISGTLPYFWPFQVVRTYARYCHDNGSRIGPDLHSLSDHASVLERLVTPFRPVFTHNDLVPQNVMLDKQGQVFLIDWDYGAYGHPLFDLAAITANIDDDEGLDAKILALYAGGPDSGLWKQFRLFKLIINLRETLWGAVQELSSELDREIVEAGMASIYPDQEQGYTGYTEMNRKRFYRNLAEFRTQYD